MLVSKDQESLKLEWARDTAFRFFPVIEDLDLGFRLHDVDLAVNKCLALANRNELRDILDLIQINKKTLALSACCWAACAKDPGFTPDLIMNCIKRNSIIRPELLEAESLTKKIEAPELKSEWLSLLNETEKQLKTFPAKDLGCIYLDQNKEVVKRPHTKHLSTLLKHIATVGGSWPQIKD